MKHKTIFMIHGLNSSSSSFNYLCEKLKLSNPNASFALIEYKSHQPLEASIAEVLSQLPKTGSIYLVGHSLGGVIATIIAADHPARIEKLVTISSPIHGSRAAATLQWIPGSLPVLCDIVPHGAIITRCCELLLNLPTLSIISTGGHLPTSPEPNDSVVSLASQRALKFGKKVEVHASHFEVLLHEKTVKTLIEFLFGDKK